MTTQEIMAELDTNGLRVAEEYENGWYVRYAGGIRVWVTEK